MIKNKKKSENNQRQIGEKESKRDIYNINSMTITLKAREKNIVPGQRGIDIKGIGK